MPTHSLSSPEWSLSPESLCAGCRVNWYSEELLQGFWFVATQREIWELERMLGEHPPHPRVGTAKEALSKGKMRRTCVSVLVPREYA